jgi:predicted permease
MSWISRLTNVFRSGRLDRDLDAELQFHIEARTDELIAQGLSPQDASREAQRHFGNRLRLRESSREVKLISWLESVFQDVRFGLRMLLKNRAVTAAAVLSLSLAIGACTGAFSLLDALILKPLPVRDPYGLIRLTHSDDFRPSTENDFFNYALFDDFREASKGRVELFGITFGGVPRSVVFDDSGQQEEKVRPEWISGGGFTLLGIQPVLGRLITVNDDGRQGEHRVVVLSYNFWMRRFGGSPTVLGRWLTWNDAQYQIVGVAQKGFIGVEPGYATDLWTPIEKPSNANVTSGFDSAGFRIWGRLKPGVAPEQIRQVLQATFTNYRRENVNRLLEQGAAKDVVANFINSPLSLRSAARGDWTIVRYYFERPLWILAVVVGLVLLIACSNVANLLVARAAAREREMAMRISIGAGRARLIQQLLIESSLIAVAACALGLAFAAASAPYIVNLLSPSNDPAYLDLHLEWRMLGFVALIGIATTMFFGLAPAVRASSVSPHEALKAGGGKQPGKTGVLRPLLAAQVSFSFAVLFVGGLLLLTFQKITSVDLGFSKTGLVLFDVEVKDSKEDQHARVIASQLLDHIRQLSGVQGTAMSAQGLIGGDYTWIATPGIRFPGRAPESVKPVDLAVSPGFFETMQIPLLDGRDFTGHDAAPGSTAVVVNQAFVRQYLSDQSPLGKTFEKRGDDPSPSQQEIVGVVRDAKFNNLREQNTPTVYEPMRGVNGTLEVRTAGDPLAVVPAIRQSIQDVNPELRVTSVILQSTKINNTLLRERLLALLAGFFAIVALVLAAIGLYGVLSYSVVRRTKEIGIRIALGARQLGVVRLVISDVMLVIAIGLGIGIAGGFALGRFVATLLFEVKASDFWSLALPLACFLLACALAALPPAFRAAHVDPIVALREE